MRQQGRSHGEFALQGHADVGIRGLDRLSSPPAVRATSSTSPAALRSRRSALKVFTPDKTDHSPILLLGDDSRGEWTRAYGLAPPAKVAEMIDELIGSQSEGGGR